MGIKTYRPYTPSRRHMTGSDFSEITKTTPEKSLLASKSRTAGRNNQGKIDLAEDRDLFREMMEKLDIPMPESGMAVNVEEALEIAEKIGYPVMVRPSYVLGGRGMEVVYDAESMVGYMNAAVGVTPDRSDNTSG